MIALMLFVTLGLTDEPPTERRCTATAFDGVNTGSLKIFELPGFNVLEQTTNSDIFQLPPGLPANIIDVTCGRSSPVFAPNDYKVALAGFRFFITSLAPAGEWRTLALTFEDGRFGYFMTQGKLSDDEYRAQQARLREFQDAIRKNE